MLNELNSQTKPYSSPAVVSEPAAGSLKFLRRHLLVMTLILLPILAATPLHFWVFHKAGGWVVSTDLEPEHRHTFLFLVWIAIQFSITVLAWFPASVILCKSRTWPLLSGAAAVVLGILLIPAVLVMTLLEGSFLKWG